MAGAALLLAACEGPPLVTPPGGTVGEMAVVAPPAANALTIPADVVAPVLSCGALGSIPIQLPCELGFSPVSEVDCTLGGASAGNKLAFMLGASLADGRFTTVVLGASTPFHATPLFGAPGVSGGYSLTDLSGSVTFTALSFSDRMFDGWFRHLTVVLTGSDGSIVPCTLDEGRFTAVPGNYL